jgi:hypothetical protein
VIAAIEVRVVLENLNTRCDVTKMYSLKNFPETVIKDAILPGGYSFRGLSCAFSDFRASYFLSYREVKLYVEQRP